MLSGLAAAVAALPVLRTPVQAANTSGGATARRVHPSDPSWAECVSAARDTATNPAVLDAFALVIIAGGRAATYPGIPGHEPDLAVARNHAGKIDKSMEELRKIASDAGSYVSESNFFEQSWQRSYSGLNYPRLQAVKAKYDPLGLFFVHHGVGSQEWRADGFTRLTVP